MALNRDKILNELSDVMNQLQSADCGCMESLFTPSPGKGMMAVPSTNGSQVLGACNPVQLYNETYNYLNENLVKPVVQEVYQDLKSLTPENTMANNPLAQQIIGANSNNTGSTPVNSLSNQDKQQSQPKLDQYGINEFNKMFPQIQQGGDLGFDPMALAMQMNPNNQQQATIGAMHTMAHGLATGPQTHGKANHVNALETYANTLQSNANSPQTYVKDANKDMNNNHGNYDNEINNNNIRKVYNSSTNEVPPSLMVSRNGLTPQDQVPYNTWTQDQYHQKPPQDQTNSEQQNNQWQQQASQFCDQKNPLQQQYQAAATAAATIVPAAFGHSPASTTCGQKVVKEPILAVDTSNIRYNTLGQPYEVIPEHMIHRPNFPLPQTLSPIPPPVKPMKFGTVKSTISKTALMGTRPVGKQPSKSQLQQIYKQYRGSNSYPNLGGIVTPYKESTNQPVVPLENVGDDSNIKEITIKLQQIDGDQIGDGPIIKKIVEQDDSRTRLHNGRRRNGLQDVVSTHYTSNKSPKWSFHGDTHVRPHYTTYRFKSKN